MTSRQQLALPIALGLRELGQRAGARLLSIVRDVVQANPEKQETIAKAIGVSTTLLSQALKSQRAFHLEWLPALLPFDHERRILKHLAWEAHCRIEFVEQLSDAEKLHRLRDELRASGADLEALEQRAYARGEP